jgi:thiol-disulfide isomerase/thioredoxin
VYFSIKGVGEFDFGLCPGDTAIITLKKGKDWGQFVVSGSLKVIESTEFINKILISQSDKLRNKNIQLDSLTIARATSRKIQNWKIEYDSIYRSIFLNNTAYSDTVSSAVASAIALQRFVYEIGEYDILKNINKAIKKFGNLVTFQSLMASFNNRLQHPHNAQKIDTLNLINLFQPEMAKSIKKIVREKKLVLIDFWASWCKPCIEEFPILDSVYRIFKKRNFEIISISLDEDSLLWAKAKKRFSMKWSKNFIEKDGFNSKPAKALNIKSIPKNYLIDMNGRVYGKNLRGSQLLETLSKLL